MESRHSYSAPVVYVPNVVGSSEDGANSPKNGDENFPNTKLLRDYLSADPWQNVVAANVNPFADGNRFLESPRMLKRHQVQGDVDEDPVETENCSCFTYFRNLFK